MKTKQKIISILLIIMLIVVQIIPILNVNAVGTPVTTYGENEDGINPNLVTNRAKLNVSGVYNNDELSAYKIIDVFYNASTNEMTYDFTSNFKTFLEQSTDDNYKNMTIEDYFDLTSDQSINSSSVITASTLNVLVSKYTTYIRNNAINGTVDLARSVNNYVFADVEAGAYLILPKQVNSNYEILDFGSMGSRPTITRNLYGVMVANVVFEVSQGNYILNDVSVQAKADNAYFDTMLVNFSSEQYTNYLNGLSEDITLYFEQNISSSLGKKNLYTIEYWGEDIQFPTNAINKNRTITIEFPEGLDYDKSNIYTIMNFGEPFIKVIDGKLMRNGVELALVTMEDKKLTIQPLVEEQSFIICFDVWLNSDSVVGDEGNLIETNLTIPEDPYVADKFVSLEIENTITTYGLELTSFGEKTGDGSAPLLQGAKYEIYSKYKNSEFSGKIGEFTVGDSGKVSFAGVPSGVIYLKQVKAPTGYQLIKNVIPVEIATENAVAGSQSGYYQTFTYNDAMWYLPSTGGIGTVLYTVIGLLVIGLSTFAIIYYRKRKFSIN